MIQIHNNVIDDGWQRAKNPTYGTPRRHPSQNGHIGFPKIRHGHNFTTSIHDCINV
jgi:hypothetical protein